MSVFTEVGRPELAAWLARCGAGDLDAFHGVDGGVENTNYFVETDRGRFVLTLFEWMPAADAARSLRLTAALADAGLAVARPWPQPDGWLAELAGKPAALADWIDGYHPDSPTLDQCAAIGNFLGELHDRSRCVATAEDQRGPEWCRRTAGALDGHLPAADIGLLDDALGQVDAIPDLPTGVIHADLFRDNALFNGAVLNGVIDFHYACRGPFVYDLAVAALDWCHDGDRLDARRLAALCSAYASVRTPDPVERAAFPALLVRAALRFWLSRAYDERFPRPGRAVLVKDASEMRERLAASMRTPVEWPE